MTTTHQARNVLLPASAQALFQTEPPRACRGGKDRVTVFRVKARRPFS